MTVSLRELLTAATPKSWWVTPDGINLYAAATAPPDREEPWDEVEEDWDRWYSEATNLTWGEFRSPADAALVVSLRNQAEEREDVIDAAKAVYWGLTCDRDPMDVDERIGRLGAALSRLAATEPQAEQGGLGSAESRSGPVEG